MSGAQAARPARSAELGLQLAQAVEQIGRAHVGRPGRQAGAETTVGLAVPPSVKLLDPLEAALRELRIELERARLADRRVRAVPRPLAQHQAQARVGERARIAVEPGALLQHQGGAAPDRFDRAQQRHDTLFVRAQRGQRQRRQAAGERRRMRGREVLVDPAGQDAREVRVRVRKAGKDCAPAAVDALGVRVARGQLGARAEFGDAAVAHGDRGVVEDRAALVRGDDRRVVDELHGRHPAYCPVGARASQAVVSFGPDERSPPCVTS